MRFAIPSSRPSWRHLCEWIFVIPWYFFFSSPFLRSKFFFISPSPPRWHRSSTTNNLQPSEEWETSTISRVRHATIGGERDHKQLTIFQKRNNINYIHATYVLAKIKIKIKIHKLTPHSTSLIIPLLYPRRVPHHTSPDSLSPPTRTPSPPPHPSQVHPRSSSLSHSSSKTQITRGVGSRLRSETTPPFHDERWILFFYNVVNWEYCGNIYRNSRT